jgi:uncharacterized membrane protein YdjX (TVP38/TMEM64 family)
MGDANPTSQSNRTALTASIGIWFQQLGPLTFASGAALGLFFLVAAFVVFPKTLLLLTAGATFGQGAAPVILLGGTAGGILPSASPVMLLRHGSGNGWREARRWPWLLRRSTMRGGASSR